MEGDKLNELKKSLTKSGYSDETAEKVVKWYS